MNRIIAAVALLVLAGAAVAQTPPGWLSAADYGASGSTFTTGAVTTAGSNRVTVKEVGDFRVGQGVMISRCNIQYSSPRLWGPRKIYESNRALKGELEFRGYDGSAGSWFVYMVDCPQTTPAKFRYSDDFGRTWHEGGLIDDQWHKLSGGTEVKFGKFDWQDGYTVVFSARDQLMSRIEKIEGNVLTLKDTPNRSADDAVVRHSDDAALQTAIDEAIKQQRNLYIPPGHYCLAKGVVARKPMGLTIQGANPQDVVLDISEGNGVCITMSGGTECTLRNITMVGHMGLENADQAGYMNTLGGRGLWGFYMKTSGATALADTERVLVENCHARRMSQEAFVSGGVSRAAKPPRTNTKSTTYLRCSAVDCGRNGFNDWNCGPENTSVLYCRIVDVGGCAWEGASRFMHFVGNYVRNSGTVAMGNLGPPNHDDTFPTLGAGQHIIADNVFEGGTRYGGKPGNTMIVSSYGSTQVIIRDNIFVNFNAPAIEVSGRCDDRHYPSANSIISGNIIDLTCVGETPVPRWGISASANDTTICNNQIYVRGAAEPTVTGIKLAEPAVNVNVHDNLIRNCGQGVVTARAQSRVNEVIDDRTFTLPGWSGVPVGRAPGNDYKGWNIAWLASGKVVGQSVLEGCDPVTCQFKLREPRVMKAGDTFELYPASGANWNLHHNTVAGCSIPVVLDSYGSVTSSFSDNTIARGEATGVKEAVAVRGQFNLQGNTFSGFDQPGSVALGLYLDRLGQPSPILSRGNVFEQCASAISEEQKGMWEVANQRGAGK
ncbi:MAG: right-handed parallel beta-helix repeat-containing protein [Armatimonadia bacterium]